MDFSSSTFFCFRFLSKSVIVLLYGHPRDKTASLFCNRVLYYFFALKILNWICAPGIVLSPFLVSPPKILSPSLAHTPCRCISFHLPDTVLIHNNPQSRPCTYFLSLATKSRRNTKASHAVGHVRLFFKLWTPESQPAYQGWRMFSIPLRETK